MLPTFLSRISQRVLVQQHCGEQLSVPLFSEGGDRGRAVILFSFHRSLTTSNWIQNKKARRQWDNESDDEELAQDIKEGEEEENVEEQKTQQEIASIFGVSAPNSEGKESESDSDCEYLGEPLPVVFQSAEYFSKVAHSVTTHEGEEVEENQDDYVITETNDEIESYSSLVRVKKVIDLESDLETFYRASRTRHNLPIFELWAVVVKLLKPDASPSLREEKNFRLLVDLLSATHDFLPYFPPQMRDPFFFAIHNFYLEQDAERQQLMLANEMFATTYAISAHYSLQALHANHLYHRRFHFDESSNPEPRYRAQLPPSILNQVTELRKISPVIRSPQDILQATQRDRQFAALTALSSGYIEEEPDPDLFPPPEEGELSDEDQTHFNDLHQTLLQLEEEPTLENFGDFLEPLVLPIPEISTETDPRAWVVNSQLDKRHNRSSRLQ